MDGAAWQFELLGLPARLARPWALALFGALVLVAGLLWVRLLIRSRRQLAEMAPVRLWDHMAPRAGRGREAVGGGAVLFGLILLSIAAAQPQCGTRTEVAKRYGMDVVIALDASGSMLARDVKPSRLARARLELSSLIDRLKGDRVGVVAFAGEAFVQCPLTTDYSAAKLFLRAVEPDALPQQGTALAAALRTAGTLFEEGERASAGRAVVVMTDGEDHEGDVEEVAAQLASRGVRLFTVGVGSTSGEPIPMEGPNGEVTGYRKDANGNTVMTRLNETVLQAVASKGNGRYVHAMSGDLGVGEIAEELARMDKAEFESRLTVQYDERYHSFAGVGVALVSLGFMAGEGRWRRRRKAGEAKS